MRSNPEVGVAIITHKAKGHLGACIQPLQKSSLKPKILVVNSSSCDGTVEEAQRLGVDTLVIPRHEFNHGRTRELARKALGTPIVVMMTPDAYATSVEMLERLIEPIAKGEAVLAYARQVARCDAGVFESFSRAFNYPAFSERRRLVDVPHLGVYAFFCSNSCCAYSNSALDEIGGFTPVLLGEDTVAAAMFLRSGKAIAYVADAVVQHSHNYSLMQEFRRHFDIGYARRQQSAVLDFGVRDSTRGWLYTRQLLKQVAKKMPLQLPYAVCQLVAKWTGYRIGQAAIGAPKRLARWLSSQDYYWDS